MGVRHRVVNMFEVLGLIRVEGCDFRPASFDIQENCRQKERHKTNMHK